MSPEVSQLMVRSADEQALVVDVFDPALSKFLAAKREVLNDVPGFHVDGDQMPVCRIIFDILLLSSHRLKPRFIRDN